MKALMSLTSFIATLVLVTSVSFGGPSVTSGVGNPATIFCLNVVGGNFIRVLDEDRNQSAVCKLGKSIVGEWTLYSAYREFQSGKAITYKAIIALLESANSQSAKKLSAKENCEQKGGFIENNVLEENPNKFIAMCSFDDSSNIEAKTLLAGPNAKSNQLLMQLFK